MKLRSSLEESSEEQEFLSQRENIYRFNFIPHEITLSIPYYKVVKEWFRIARGIQGYLRPLRNHLRGHTLLLEGGNVQRIDNDNSQG